MPNTDNKKVLWVVIGPASTGKTTFAECHCDALREQGKIGYIQTHYNCLEILTLFRVCDEIILDANLDDESTDKVRSDFVQYPRVEVRIKRFRFPLDGSFTSLGSLQPGSLFETPHGLLAVKTAYRYSNKGQCQCVLLHSGEYAHFPQGDDTPVRRIEPPTI
jgi:hypothetical protein